MTMWLVRAGGAGEREQVALDNNVAVVGWEEMPDLVSCSTREQLQALLRDTYPAEKPRTLASWQNQIWPVRNVMQVGDLVALPLKSRAAIAFGIITGDYVYRRDLPGAPMHTRPVEWLAQVPRSAFDPDVLFSFGAFMSVCRVERNDAEQRVRGMLAQKTWAAPSSRARPSTPALRIATASAPLSIADFEERSHAMIRDRIAQRFKGHRLASLVATLLEVQGFQSRVAPPGPDGGVDILAGSGPLGFDAPRLAVQVKSQDAKVDVRVLREMAGVMHRFQADHGLLVAWGGFNQSVRAEGAPE
jgi:restriction system protein